MEGRKEEVLVEVHPALLLDLEVQILLALAPEVQILLLALDLAEVRMVEVHHALARILVRILEAFQVIVYMDT
jgi:hypothetical protein